MEFDIPANPIPNSDSACNHSPCINFFCRIDTTC